MKETVEWSHEVPTNSINPKYRPLDGVKGTRFKTNNYGYCEVVEYVNNRKVIVKFDSGYVTTSEMGQLRRGDVKDKSLPNIKGVAYNDYPYPVKINGKHIPEYRLWRNVIERCLFSTQKAYADVTVAKGWLHFSKFKKDIESMENSKMLSEGWHLDKDILVKGNKIYSPETCCFVPKEVNSAFVGLKNTTNLPLGVKFCKRNKKYASQIMLEKKKVHLGYFKTPEEAFIVYKTEKERWLKAVAEKWKGVIADNVYQAIVNYEVSIND